MVAFRVFTLSLRCKNGKLNSTCARHLKASRDGRYQCNAGPKVLKMMVSENAITFCNERNGIIVTSGMGALSYRSSYKP